MEHAALHWILTTNDLSGCLIKWRPRIAAFDFAVKYKNGKVYTHNDPLWRLNTLSETIRHEDSDHIPLIALELLNVEPDLNVQNEEHDLLEVHSAEIDEH